MQTSKHHFEATMVYNDETIRRMFHTEYQTYERMHRLTQLAIGVALLMMALFGGLPTAATVVCLAAGSFLVLARSFHSDMQAERVLQGRGGAESRVRCRFHDGGIDVEGGQHYRYSELDRLIRDDSYYYLFRDRQTAIMLPRATLLPNSPERFEQFVSKSAGKAWQENRGLLRMDRRLLGQMIRDKATRWLGR